MVLKKLFKSARSGPRDAPAGDDELTIEDLIVLERYDEAEGRLKLALKQSPDDLHHHLKLADVYTALGRREAAADEYVFVAEEYGRDGFYDKGIALLNRAVKMTPGEDRLRKKLYTLEVAKGLEYKREAATDGIRGSRFEDGRSGTKSLFVQRQWHHLAPAPLMQRLTADQIRRLFAAVEMVRMPAGTVIAERGSQEAFLLVIVSGIVEAVLLRDDGKETGLRQFTTGDLLGEAPTFGRGTWPADYRVAEAATVLKLDRAGVQHAITGNPDPKGFLDNLRLDANDRQIAEMVARLEARTR
jgi:hypothetical protein